MLAPDGATVARSEPGFDNAWIVAELDPEILDRVRENPGFPLHKRRPETYDELATRS